MSINSIILAAGLTMANITNPSEDVFPAQEMVINLPSTLPAIASSVSSLEKSIASFPMTQDLFSTTFTKLESLQNQLQTLKNTTAMFALPFLEETEGRIVTLFGNIQALAMDHEVLEIQANARELAGQLSSSSMSAIAQRIETLRARVFDFLQQNAPGAKNLSLLHQVQKFLNATERALTKGSLAASLKRLAKLADKLFTEEILPITGVHGDDDEMVADYLQLQDLLEKKKVKDAKKLFTSLDPHVQKALQQKLNEYELDLDHKMAPAIVEEAFYDLFICATPATPLLFDIKTFQSQAV